MRKFLIVLILLIFAVPAYSTTIYKWVDKEGIINFTDDYEKVPSLYHSRVQKEEKEDVQKSGPTALSSQTPPTKREEVKTDIYGQDEAYWRGKVHPWKEFLKAAEANYEKAHGKFMERAVELSSMRFGSRTQYKMKIIELDGAKEEMVKYADQIAEAKEGFEKISKEAQEAKANPDWLK